MTLQSANLFHFNKIKNTFESKTRNCKVCQDDFDIQIDNNEQEKKKEWARGRQPVLLLLLRFNFVFSPFRLHVCVCVSAMMHVEQQHYTESFELSDEKDRNKRPLDRCIRPRPFSLVFDFRVFLVFFFVLSCFNSAFNALNCVSVCVLIPDTPTAWSTNPINDSILRTWERRKKNKNDCIFVFDSKASRKALKLRKIIITIFFFFRIIKNLGKNFWHHKLRRKEGPGQSGERNGKKYNRKNLFFFHFSGGRLFW